jgi:hypothetical protein
MGKIVGQHRELCNPISGVQHVASRARAHEAVCEV